jgi:hypothetical protein
MIWKILFKTNRVSCTGKTQTICSKCYHDDGGFGYDPNGGEFGHPNGGEFGHPNGGEFGHPNGGEFGHDLFCVHVIFKKIILLITYVYLRGLG